MIVSKFCQNRHEYQNRAFFIYCEEVEKCFLNLVLINTLMLMVHFNIHEVKGED